MVARINPTSCDPDQDRIGLENEWNHGFGKLVTLALAREENRDFNPLFVCSFSYFAPFTANLTSTIRHNENQVVKASAHPFPQW